MIFTLRRLLLLFILLLLALVDAEGVKGGCVGMGEAGTVVAEKDRITGAAEGILLEGGDRDPGCCKAVGDADWSAGGGCCMRMWM